MAFVWRSQISKPTCTKNPFLAGLPTLTRLCPSNRVCKAQRSSFPTKSPWTAAWDLQRSALLKEVPLSVGTQFSLEDGTCLKEKLGKRGWSGGKALPENRLRGNCLVLQFHEDKRILPGGWTLCAPVQFWFSSLHSARPWVFWTLLCQRFAAEHSLVSLEDLGPFCSKYDISLQIIFSY